MANVFLSHAAADKAVAELFAEALQRGSPSLSTFVASRAGDIRADVQWLPYIQRELLQSDSFVVLLTPNSIYRPWVNFEAGCAWFSGRRVVLVRTSDPPVEDIPLPLAAMQIYRIDEPHELSVVCAFLETSLQDAPRVAAAIFNIPQR